MTIRKQKRKTVDETEYTPKETTQKTSKKQKTDDVLSQGSASSSFSSQPRRSERIQTDLARVTEGLSIYTELEYGLENVPTSASQFTERDVNAFNATFVPADEKKDVIPEVDVSNFLPNEYILNIGSEVLYKKNFNVSELKDANGGDIDGYVKQFYHSLHRVVRNASAVKGTAEARTDSLMNHLLTRTCKFDEWPFGLRVKEPYKLVVGAETGVTAYPDFVIDMGGVNIIITRISI